MKRYLVFLLFIISLTASAQTGVGWAQQRAKVNFKDSVNLANGLLIGGVVQTPANWNTAYSDRLKWDGGSGGGVLVAATGRTSLGGTTVGQAFFTLTNPSAITFPRMNADNTVTALSASAFTTAIGAGHVASVTATFTAGALTDVALTGVTTKPYHIMIQTTAGKDITSAVSDSLGISGGTYHLYVYSIDLITDAEIKVTY